MTDSSAQAEIWRIDELASLAETTTRTIRYYQQEGLLPPPERQGRVAWYGPAHLQRLRQIAKLRARGYTLEMVGFLLREAAGGWPPEVWRDFKERIVQRRPGRQRITAEGLAERAGIDLQTAAAMLQTGTQSGLCLEEEGEYTVPPAALAAIVTAVRAGLDAQRVIQLFGQHHQASRQAADGLAQEFVARVLRPVLEHRGEANWGQLLATFEELRNAADLALAEAGRFALQAAMEATRQAVP